MVAIIAVGALAGRSDRAPSSELALPGPDPAAALPTGTLGTGSATPYGVPVGAAPKTASTVVVWEDFQCPYCGRLERAQGAELRALGQSGAVNLVYRVATFLDQSFPESNLSSARAANAWGAAIDAGVGEEYHAIVFANQPEIEGTGYTDDQLLDLGRQIGLSGSDYETFAKKVADHTYFGWVSNSSEAFRASHVSGTPSVWVDGAQVPPQYLEDGLVEYIDSIRRQ